MRFAWSMTEDGAHTAPLGEWADAGRIEFRVSHDPNGMKWRMDGHIHGLSSRPIKILHAVPDDGMISLDSVLEVFKSMCERDVLIHAASPY